MKTGHARLAPVLTLALQLLSQNYGSITIHNEGNYEIIIHMLSRVVRKKIGFRIFAVMVSGLKITTKKNPHHFIKCWLQDMLV